MTSLALALWQLNRASALSEFETLHKTIGRVGTGTRHARQQINQAYVLMLAGQFQGYCRDLHSECVDHLVSNIQPSTLRSMLASEFQFGRTLDTGNANSGTIGSDFNRFELRFWDIVKAYDSHMPVHKAALDSMNEWRNKIAHQVFSPHTTGGAGSTMLQHSEINSWRRSCNRLAKAFDSVMADHLASLTGIRPW